ncbi:MAG: hypothetical protein GXO04_02405 [Aquificae bacterium]|nr:hypothetical protein [Aquificota bacterium]
MNVWKKVLSALCKRANEEKRELFVFRADDKPVGVSLSEVCSRELPDEDAKLVEFLRRSATGEVNAGPYAVFISPLNLFADVYETGRGRFFGDITLEGFGLGFFENKKDAVDFMLGVRKALLEEFNLHLHLFYT